MHSAPAIRYPVVRPTGAGWGLLSLWCGAAFACACWGWWGGATAPRLLFATIVWLAGAWLAWQQWRHLPTGQLRWDGTAWWWQPSHAEDEMPVMPRLHGDFQSAVLLRLAGLPGRAHGWCYVDARQWPARWVDLRRALFARAAPMAGALPAP